MFRVRRFGVIRTANIVAFLYVVVIAVVAIPIGLIVAVAAPSSLSGNAGGFVGSAAGLGVLFIGLLAALVYGVFGWIFTAIACLLYNFAAGVVGGIEIQLEAVQPPPAPVAWGSANVPPGPPGADPVVPPGSPSA